MRFNPPPGWPPAPAGWTPPPGWQPDPAWPPAPPGWPLWVDEPAAPTQAPAQWPAAGPGLAAGPAAGPGAPQVRDPRASLDARWTLGGGAAVVLGSVLPWVSVTSSGVVGVSINGGARGTSAVFGLILLGLGAAIVSRASRGAKSLGYAIALLVLSILGTLGYAIFAIAGFAGFDETDALGDTAHVTFSPSVGLIMLFLGCVAVVYGAIRALRHGNPRPPG
jgi:hypothetical protein